jgi:hypothetical protein
MPSKRRPAKRRKRRAPKLWSPPRDWRPWLWGLFAANVLAGLLFSPATGLRSVRVLGAPPYDQARLRGILARFAGEPYLRVDGTRVRALALEDLSVEGAEYRANLFGRGVLRLSYHQPVARIADEKGLYLSRTGAVFRAPVADPPLLTVEPPVPAVERNLAAFGSWRSGQAARMCENIGARLPEREWRMVVSAAGFVELLTEGGSVVEFGSFEDSDLKVQVLAEVLRDDPDLLEKNSRINLASPSEVRTVPR